MRRNNSGVRISLDEKGDTYEGGDGGTVAVFGVRLDTLSTPVQLGVYVVGVFVCFLAYGLIQEGLFNIEGFTYGWFLTLVQFVIYAVLSYSELRAQGPIVRRAPMSMYIILAAVLMTSMGLSNHACGLLNYPTQVIFKCCKIIPVMIMGKFVLDKLYTPLEYVGALTLSFGLVWFTMADVTVSPVFHAEGVLAMIGALLADSIIGNVQERMMKRHSASQLEMVYYSDLVGIPLIMMILLMTGQIWEAVPFCITHPSTMVYMLGMSVTGYVGVLFVLALVKKFGALVSVIVTSTRKALTIILSFLFFPKPFTMTYVYAGCVVLLGIGIQTYCKQQKKQTRRVDPLSKNSPRHTEV